MKPIRTVIIDDEPIGIEVIKALITELTTDLVVVGTATNGKDALEKISALTPDLIFLDVAMPHMSGTDVLRNLPHQKLQIVFTSGYEPREIKGFFSASCEWLSKPIDPGEFLGAVEKARNRIHAGANSKTR